MLAAARGLVLLAALAGPLLAETPRYFVIRVVDEATGRGVPLVELKTVHNTAYYTDSAGIIAFHEPGLMDQAVYFHVRSHGYEYPKDGFGYQGAQLKITAGGQATLKLARRNIAERIYRVTGAGIYRDSQLVGAPVPLKAPVLNAQVFGSDSVVNAIYRGKVYWFWGDTNRPSYPLGNFHVPGAVSALPVDGGLDPARGVDLEYFVDEAGFAKPMAQMPGKGPTWIDGLVTLREAESGAERLFAAYAKVRPPLEVYRRGLVEFDPQSKAFRHVADIDLKTPLYPHGHPSHHVFQGRPYVVFGNPFPLVRVPASADALQDGDAYEAFTCLKAGSREESLEVERVEGEVVFTWKPNTIRWTPKLEARLIREGKLAAEEGLFQLRGDDGKPVLIHSGSVAWNKYRRRWIMIGLQAFGSSPLGEVWYAEAETLTGPWRHPRKIVTHEKYSFYNPKHHPMFDQDGGRVIYFEGTYTNTFSGNDEQTPRYNYNQIMYRLDLSDPRLRPSALK